MSRHFYLSAHTLDRYEEFYPGTLGPDLLQVVYRSLEITPSEANRLRGHPANRDERAHFYLHPERTGFFVVEADPAPNIPGTVITFFRFYSEAQHQLAVRLRGPGERVTAVGRCRWSPEPERRRREEARLAQREAARRGQKTRAAKRAQRAAETTDEFEASLISSPSQHPVRQGEWVERLKRIRVKGSARRLFHVEKGRVMSRRAVIRWVHEHEPFPYQPRRTLIGQPGRTVLAVWDAPQNAMSKKTTHDRIVLTDGAGGARLLGTNRYLIVEQTEEEHDEH